MTALAHKGARASMQGADRFAFVPGVHGTAALPAVATPNATGPKSTEVDIGPLATIASPVAFAAGAPVMREGDRADHLFRIASGVVKVCRTLSDGRCQIIGFLFAGDFLGLVPEDVYLSSATAIGAVTVSRFPRKQVEQLVAVSPLVARLLFRRACSELIAAQDQMLLLGRKSATEKVASFLMMIARRGHGDALDLPVTRADMADYLGLTIETVSRTLTQLRVDGVIGVKRAKIRIVRRAALEDLAEAA
jgi:CRP/FNR family transcriptional regulator